MTWRDEEFARNWRFPFCPEPPHWTLDWEGIVARFAWARALHACPQDPIHHAEGDVGTHTKWVCEELAQLSAWRGLSPPERSIIFSATLMHDIAKPVCTREEFGKLTSRGHARRGASLAREVLWDLWPGARCDSWFQLRESVVALIRWHGLPLYFLERADPQRAVLLASQTARCDWLAVLAEADARGRICNDQADLLDRVALFRDFADEQACLRSPREFPSPSARAWYFRHENAMPDLDLPGASGGPLILVCGLPGAGKDAWIRAQLPDLPVVSLDDVRAELGIEPTDPQGTVVVQGKERAREHLRAGRPFVWNATSLNRMFRDPLAQLAADYRAALRIVYVETGWDELLRRNRTRAAKVSQKVLLNYRSKLEIPDLTEAPQVEWIMT